MKGSLKEKAISLRKEGFSYSEILKRIPVAKSTLSLWLRDVGMSKKQAQIFTERKRLASLRGGQARRAQRLSKVKDIFESTKKDIISISRRELFLIGVVLYWAEGNKEKESHPGGSVMFNNSDPRMVAIFIRWLLEICLVKRADVSFEIYIHKNHTHSLGEIKEYWSKATRYPNSVFEKVYYKAHNPKTNRKRVGDLYYGLLRVRVKGSSILLRHISGWTQAIVDCL